MADYTQIPVEESQVKQETPTPEESRLIVQTARGVASLAFTQMCIASIAALNEGYIFAIVTAFGALLGAFGATKRSLCLLITHFVFSLILYILSMLFVIGFIVYCNGCSWWIFIGGLLLIFAQAVGMRNSRILISLMRKYRTNTGRCWTKRCCRANKNNINQTTQTPSPVSTETQTPSPVQNIPQQTPFMFMPAPVDPNTGLPTQQFFPQPMFVPQGYMPMNFNGGNYPMMVPMMPQPPMVPPPVYTPSAPAPQEGMYPIYITPKQDA